MGKKVAVVGLGGLGHMAVKLAVALGTLVSAWGFVLVLHAAPQGADSPNTKPKPIARARRMLTPIKGRKLRRPVARLTFLFRPIYASLRTWFWEVFSHFCSFLIVTILMGYSFQTSSNKERIDLYNP